MTRYFVLAYALFVAAFLLLLGVGKYPNDNHSVTIFGYGRFAEGPTYLVAAALALAGGWNVVQWRRTRTGIATTSIGFLLANVWYGAGLLLLVGTWSHPSSGHRATFFGYGQFETPAVYMANFALFAFAIYGVRRWTKAGRPGVSEGNFFALAYLWFILGMVLFLGIGDHANGPRHAAIYGYGKLEVQPPYLAVGFLFTAAFMNFRRWRRVKDATPAPTPTAAVAAPTKFPWQYAAFGGVVILMLMAMVITQTGSKFQPVEPYRFPMADPRWEPEPPHQDEPEDWNDDGPARRQPAVAAFVALPVVFFTAFGLTCFFVMRLIRRNEMSGSSTDHARDVPVDAHSDGWTRPQKQRIAGLFAFLATVFITLVAVWTVREYGRSDTNFSKLLVIVIVLSIVAFAVSKRLYRWAYPEWYATRPEYSAPDRTPAMVAERPAAPVERACPKCRAPIAADAPQGLCPRCLLAGAFQSVLNPSRTGPYAGPFAPPTPEEVQEHFPNLEILGLVGSGGMGAVYQARQSNLDRFVALKLIRPRDDNPMFAERFVREAKAMAKLTHANIATIYESGEAGGSLYLLMEYVDGVTLREAIRAKTMTSATAMQIVGQLCEALEYAHAQGVVHRDIKPENILLDRNGKVKVVDFGLAKLSDDNALSLTHTRQAMGTPHYMAPEQWEKPTEVDHRADIYALGVVIYELLTGELPLGRFDPPSVKSRLDARIDEIVLKLLAKEPDRRYQRASDVRTALFGLGDLAVEGTVRLHDAGNRRLNFYEYKTTTEFLGWPLVHVVGGVDPRTGTRRVAKGWIALGDMMAIGVLAFGGMFSIGLVSLAGIFGLGLLALAGAFAAGGVSVGGVAIGLASLGGVSLGYFAFGGLALGRFAAGGRAIGQWTLDGNTRDAAAFWKRLGDELLSWFN